MYIFEVLTNLNLTAKILTLKSFAVIICVGADNMIKRESLLKKLIDYKDKDIINVNSIIEM